MATEIENGKEPITFVKQLTSRKNKKGTKEYFSVNIPFKSSETLNDQSFYKITLERTD